jgi:hypothetical protein
VQSGGERWVGFRDGWTLWLAGRHLAGGLHGDLPVCHLIDNPGYRVLQVLGGLGALAWCLVQRRRAPRLGRGPGWLVHVTLAAGLAWLMLFGPAVEHATYVFLAPPLAWAAVQPEAWRRGRALLLAAFALVNVLGWGAAAREVGRACPPAASLLLAALPAGTTLFTLWLVGYAAACRPLPAPETGDDVRPDEWSETAGEPAASRPRRPALASATRVATGVSGSGG